MLHKRILCVFLLLLLLLTGGVLSEETEEEVPYEPERDAAGVHLFDYADTIVPGQVRFVSQQFATAGSYGWGKYAKNRSTTYGPAHNCTSAVQSMAFSYIGIDATPEQIEAMYAGEPLQPSMIKTDLTVDAPLACSNAAFLRICL